MDNEIRKSWAPVLVGIAPSGLNEAGQPLSPVKKGSTGSRIMEMCGLTRSEYLKTFDRVNICPHQTKNSIKPSEFREFAENLAGSILRDRRVVLLGPNVASCFGINRESYNYLEWKIGLGCLPGWRVGMRVPFDWAVLPHPSGLNRWYNETDNRERASTFLRELSTSR